MYDMHYDLLTILYFNLKNNNKLSNQDKLISDCLKIYNNNVLGGIIDLYFMSPNEMLDELGITSEELQDVKKMFKQSINYLNTFKEKGIIPANIDFIYSIEGCDYLKDENDLDELYELGLRAILPVWNEKNKFGSGNRSSEGLTLLGEKLIKKAIDLGIIIDVSHANKQTFNDILDVIENEQQKGKKVMVVATHSNVRALCNRDRNLDDEQLIRLKNVGGYIGLFTNGNFLSLNNKNLTLKERQKEYINHLRYIIEKIEFPTNKILVSTDDMNFSPDTSYHNKEAFPLDTIAGDTHMLITEYFNKQLADDILINNPQNILGQVRIKDNNSPKIRYK